MSEFLDTARADRSLWLMKCPTVVSRAWQEAAAAAADATGGVNPNPNPVVAKVIVSLDPLNDNMSSTQLIADDNGKGMRLLPVRPLVVNPGPKEKKPTKGFETKRTRMDRGELEKYLFKLFERQPNWSLKQLMQETNQPEQFLKEILNELCVYNKRGPNQGTHELRPEYKNYTEDDPTA